MNPPKKNFQEKSLENLKSYLKKKPELSRKQAEISKKQAEIVKDKAQNNPWIISVDAHAAPKC